MLSLSDYSILEKIGVTGSNLLYRAERYKDSQRVILKVLENTNAKSSAASRIKNEYEIASSFSSKAIASYLQLETYHDRFIAVLQDIEGISLVEYLQSSKSNIRNSLKIAIGITEILEQFYQKGIVHQDLCPAHLIVNQDTLEVCLIDLSHASRVTTLDRIVEQPDFLKAGLVYISPEQTGKVKGEIDIRSDLYSLGVILYEMAAGEAPFTASDASALIYCHVAKNPLPPHIKNVHFPIGFSRVILKLLSKNAGERYQSPFGLKSDLQACLDQWDATHNIVSFELGQYDYSNRLQTPKKFYGREPEMDGLHQAFHEVSNGAVKILMVEGYSGVGKSALIHQFKNASSPQGALFIEGKFNQFQRNIPYFAFIQALKEFTDFILAQSVDMIAVWRKQILKSVGINGKLITDIIPHLELLIGSQPQLPLLEPSETQNRLNYVFINFIKTIAQKDRPLVIFFDDLQWLDVASLTLLKTIILDKDLTSFLFIGAYRNNEIDAGSAFLDVIENMQNEGCLIKRILLSPLTRENVEKIILETLNYSVRHLQSFVDFVYAKSKGNPFFINAFLKCLHTGNLLVFDIDKREWTWDANEIVQVKFSDDIVELMTGRIQKLPDTSQELLKLAACLGYEFNMPLLIALLNQTTQEIINNLEAAVDENLVILTKDNYRFTHDRIQQAVYSLIPKNRIAGVHRKIGKTLLKNLDVNAQYLYTFEIVDQLNSGIDAIGSQEEKDELAALNLSAGIKARNSAAYRPYFEYLQRGIALLHPQSWSACYELTLQLFTKGSESAFLSGNSDIMQQWLDVVLQNASGILDKVKAYEVMIMAFTARHQLLEAVQTSLEVLKKLNIHFPKSPKKIHVQLALWKIRMAFLGKTETALITVPTVENLYAEAAIRILVIVGSSAAYFAMPKLFPLFVCKAYFLVFRYGNKPFSGVVCACYGLVMAGDIGNIEKGYKMGKVAVELSDKFATNSLKCQTAMMVNNFILHWKEPLKNILEPLYKNYWNSLETGNTEFASFTAGLYCCNSFFCGKNLGELTAEILTFNETIGQLRQEIALNMQRILTQAVFNLQEPQNNPIVLTGKFHDEAAMLQVYKETKAEPLIFHVYLFKLILSYLFENFDESYLNAQEARLRLHCVPGSSRITIFYFYDTLTLLSLITKYSVISQKLLLKTVYSNLKKFRKFAKYGPANCCHKLLLIEAELYRVTGRLEKAALFYDKAIEGAKKNEYPNDLALSCELAGKFYLSQHREFIAQHYIIESYKLYRQWGAMAKVKHMERKYFYIFEKQRFDVKSNDYNVFNEDKAIRNTDLPTERAFRELDLRSVMKAAAAISGEIQLDKLLETLVRIAVENAGAQQGYLILKKDNGFFIEAERVISVKEQVVLKSIPVKGNKVLSEAIVQFVYLTKENLVIDNAILHDHFSQDPIIIEKGTKSVLCMPIILQGDVIGMLYFENDLITNAFTQDRIELLRLLSGQMAIALQNALNEQKKINAFLERENLLKQINAHQQELLKTRIEIQEQTYRNISEELHDNIGQTLTFIKIIINTIDMKAPDAAKEKLAESTTHIKKAINDLRNLAKTLNTDFIENAGLVESIKDQLQFLKKTGIYSTDLSVIGESYRFEAPRELIIFRIVQELLNNVVKHANASAIQIVIDYQMDKMVIAVKDDGRGFDISGPQPPVNKGLGLRNIHNRATLIRGEVSINSQVQSGTTAVLQVFK